MNHNEYVLNRMATAIEVLNKDLSPLDRVGIVQASYISCLGDYERLFDKDSPLKSKYRKLLEDLRKISLSFQRYIRGRGGIENDGGIIFYSRRAQDVLLQMLDLVTLHIEPEYSQVIRSND